MERAKRRLDEEEALEQQRELEQQAVGEQHDVLNEEDDNEVFEDETKETETENPDQSFSDSIVAKYLDGSFDQPQVTYSLKLSDEFYEDNFSAKEKKIQLKFLMMYNENCNASRIEFSNLHGWIMVCFIQVK